MGKYLVGLDGGTTGCKTCIFDLNGNLMGSHYIEYGLVYPKPGQVEQLTEELLPNFYESIKKAIEKAAIDPTEIIAFGFSSQAGTIGLLDENGEMIRPWVSWLDIRGGEMFDEMFEKMPRSAIYQQTGDPVGTAFTNTKYAWLSKYEPENVAKARWCVEMQEYFLKQFGADDYYTDLSSASRSGMMDIDKECWSEEMHEVCGIPVEKRAKIIGTPGMVVAHVSEEISELTGLPVGTPVCMGAHDQNCCTFGAGAVDAGTAVLVMGTFGSCFVVSDESIRDPKERLVVKGNHGCGNYTIEAFSATAASSYRWFRDVFCDYEKVKAEELGVDPYELINEQIATSPIGANGVTFLSYLQGAGGARINGNARGTFCGMTLSTNKADMARAVMEGICYDMYDIIRAEEAAGIDIGSIRLTGGAAKSPLWCQMMADIYKHPIQVLECGEAGCLGAALYAGVGVGAYKDVHEAASVVRILKEYTPNPENYEAYDAAYEKACELYDALDKKIF